MPVELGLPYKNRNNLLIADMTDGEIGEIIDSAEPKYLGILVQKNVFYNTLFAIGSDYVWSNANVLTFRVRILDDGEHIIYRSKKND